MMKKIVCALLALAMLFVFASTSLADSAKYADGQLTIYVSNPDFYSIWIDGSSAGAYITAEETSKTLTKTLSDGPHTVTLSSGSKTIDLTVNVGAATDPTKAPDPTTAPDPTKAPDPTTAPDPTEVPTGPLTLVSVSYDAVNGAVNFTVSGLQGYGEAWIDGSPANNRTAMNGSNSIKVQLGEGTYTLMVHNPDTGKSVSKSFTVKYAAPVINSAEYTKVGTLNYSVSDITNECEVWVDGGTSHSSVASNGAHTLSVTLTEGTHTLTVHNPFSGKTANFTFKVDHIAKVVPGKAATCTETGLTDGEVCEICGKELKAQEVIPMIDHTPKTVEGKEATCTEKGLSEGSVCAVCGKELEAQQEIPALGHSYRVVDKSNGRIYYKCSRCGDSFSEKDPNYVAKSNKNAYGNILKDTNNVFVDYTADGDGKILVIKADLSKEYTSEIGMYLDADLIAQIQKEGYTAIEYINGEADIVIELDGIASTWFDTNSAIWCYVFSTDPAAAEGTLVKVEAQISGTDKVPATSFKGVTLKKGAESIEITENGNY